MAITYIQTMAAPKPVKMVNIDNLSKVADVSTADEPYKYSFTDTDVIYFYGRAGITPAVSDKIVIMEDQVNYLMKAADYTATYVAVA